MSDPAAEAAKRYARTRYCLTADDSGAVWRTKNGYLYRYDDYAGWEISRDGVVWNEVGADYMPGGPGWFTEVLDAGGKP